MEYYRRQFEKLTNEGPITIKLSDYGGNTTNTISINSQSVIFLLKLIAEILEREEP
jgi:hypothetical protein